VHAKVLAPIAIVAGALAVGAVVIAARPKAVPNEVGAAAPLVRAIAVEPQTVTLTVEAHGTVAPRTEIDVVPEVSGRVVYVSPALNAGGFFDAGEALLRIDARDYELAVAASSADVAQARVALAREQAEAEVAVREWAALKGGTPPPLVAREPQLAEARAGLAAAKAKLESARLDLERTTITAGFDGRVREESVDVGQFVERGKAVARVYSVDVAEIRLPLASEELAYLSLPLGYRATRDSLEGPPVRIEADFAGARPTWRGTIVRTEGEVDPQTRMIHAVAVVEDPYGRERDDAGPPLSVGMFVDASIEGRTLENVFVLPRIALRGASRVLVVESGDVLRYRDVDVVRAERERVIVGGGLSAGDVVCISALDAPIDGMQVRVAVVDDEVEEAAP
jgi:RND family efflux transporter MFP subunit